MTDEKKEELEEWEADFRNEWQREVQKLIAFTHMGPFRKVAMEVDEAVSGILRKHFKDPRSRTIKSLILIYVLGQHIEEWVKPKGAPGARPYRKLFDLITHESALGQLMLEHAAADGVAYTNDMVNRLIKKYLRRLHIVQPRAAISQTPSR